MTSFFAGMIAGGGVVLLLLIAATGVFLWWLSGQDDDDVDGPTDEVIMMDEGSQSHVIDKVRAESPGTGFVVDNTILLDAGQGVSYARVLPRESVSHCLVCGGIGAHLSECPGVSRQSVLPPVVYAIGDRVYVPALDVYARVLASKVDQILHETTYQVRCEHPLTDLVWACAAEQLRPPRVMEKPPEFAAPYITDMHE